MTQGDKLPDHVLYRRLRQEELLAYHHTLRAFYAQSPLLTKAQQRILDDLQDSFNIPQERVNSEFECAKSDRILKVLQPVIKNRRKYRDVYEEILSEEEATEDEIELGTKRPSGAAAPKLGQSKRLKVTGNNKKAPAPAPPAPAPKPAAPASGNDFAGLSLVELSEKIDQLQNTINQLEEQMQVVLKPVQHERITTELENKRRELQQLLDHIAGLQDEELDDMDDGAGAAAAGDGGFLGSDLLGGADSSLVSF